MYVNKYDKNNIQTSGNDDIIGYWCYKSEALKEIIIKAITYFHGGPGFCDTQYTYGTQYIIKTKDTTDFQYHRL